MYYFIMLNCNKIKHLYINATLKSIYIRIERIKIKIQQIGEFLDFNYFFLDNLIEFSYALCIKNEQLLRKLTFMLQCKTNFLT